ncbi:hypothetical protein DQ384_36385 [Sphaerisporangium album]|uniref:Uncharacterized protein n=1 Tax=Sphaerisporangium album TaxID=509200 RepID=A0A367EXP8_9ACTN|nr:hypothetical protein [Sphaerisporangium album]RCG21940.1 hypothetical protein DQ384_36385 [Sphaerisporangium album]
MSTTQLTIRETRIGEETVCSIDFFSRLIGAIEDGNWRYARDKLRQLQNTLATLAAQLNRTGPASGAPVAAYVAKHSQHYRIGRALYGAAAPASPAVSPLAQAEDAKGRRDIVGELDALTDGQRSMESAPWYPARAGDVVHIHYEGVPAVTPTLGETYVVEHSATEGGLLLRALHHTPGMVGPGAFAPGLVDDPLMEIWFEAGPAALTIVRDGRVVHGGAR